MAAQKSLCAAAEDLSQAHLSFARHPLQLAVERVRQLNLGLYDEVYLYRHNFDIKQSTPVFFELRIVFSIFKGSRQTREIFIVCAPTR